MQPSGQAPQEELGASDPSGKPRNALRHAFGWSMGGAVAMSLLMTAITAVMARLLTPAAFGEFAVVAIVQAFALFFGQKGLTTAIVQRPVLLPGDMGAALIASAGIGVVMVAVIIGGTPLWFLPFKTFDHGRLVSLITIMSLSLFFACLSSPALGLLQRHMQFRALAVLQFTGVLLGNGIITISLAESGWGSTALAWGNVAGQAFAFVFATWMCRSEISFKGATGQIRDILASGFGFSALRLFDLARSQLQYSFVAILRGAAAVGLYQRSGYLLEMALQFTVARATSVLFPMLCRADEREALQSATINRFVGLYGLFVFPICAGIAAAADPIIGVVLGSQWHAAAPILRALTLASAAYYIAHPLGGLLEARRHFGDRLATVGLELAVFSLLVWTNRNSTVVYLAYSAAAAAWITIALYVVLVSLRYRISPLGLVLSFAPGAAVAAAVYLANSAALSAAGTPRPLPGFALSIAIDAIVLGAGLVSVIRLIDARVNDDPMMGQLLRSFGIGRFLQAAG